MVRWVSASYAAPHLTIPEGHVLITSDGNLVASRGFRTNLIDTRVEEGLELPILQAEDGPPLEPQPDSRLSLEPCPSIGDREPEDSTPGRRLREKTAVRFLDVDGDEEGDPEQLSKYALLDQDVSDATCRGVLARLERAETPSDDRRGEFRARYVLGAFCHFGQRGVTTLARKYPTLVKFLNGFLRSKLREEDAAAGPTWTTFLVMHASDVPIHRDYRNEWGTRNVIVQVPGKLELWTSPLDPKEGSAGSIQPDWHSERVSSLGRCAVTFDARNHHALRHTRTPDWVLVGFTPLGIHKLQEEDQEYLRSLGLLFPEIPRDLPQVKVVRSSASSSGYQGASESSSSEQPVEYRATGASSSHNLPLGVKETDLEEDLQQDSHTTLVGWDPNGSEGTNVQLENLEEADLYQFLRDREMEWAMKRLAFMGVESPADLCFLYVEDLVELGFALEDAAQIMAGIHPEGTVRPDNPNMISLTTGEVCLFDREQRQIPRVIQNRTLGYHAPGPPVLGLGVNMQTAEADPIPYLEDWQELNGYPPPRVTLPPEIDPPVDHTAPNSSSAGPQDSGGSSSRSAPALNSGTVLEEHHISAVDGDVHSMHAMWMQNVWDSRTEEEFQALVGAINQRGNPSNAAPAAEVSSARGSGEHACRMLSAAGSAEVKRTKDSSRMQGMTSLASTSARAPAAIPRIGVFIPPVVSVATPTEPIQRDLEDEGWDCAIAKVEETAFTPEIETLLEGLTAPLEVVHQVSPADVRRHLERWKPAAQEEVESMEGMQAIVRHRGEEARRLLKLPNVEVLPAKGVFTVKPGKPYRRKVRIVSCGNFAKGVSEEVLYASGAAAEVLRTVLIHAGSTRRPCWSTDVKCAFLLAPIPSNVQKAYVLKPPAILTALGICEPDEFWEVRRAVYGFKESPKWWSQYRDSELSKSTFLTHLGPARLRKTQSDDNLWEILLENNDKVGHVLVYIDDLLILCGQGIAEALHAWIRSKWGCSDLERATAHRALKFLGVDIHEVCDEFGTRGYTLSQEGYVDELIRSHELVWNAKASTPLPREWIKEAPEEEQGYLPTVLRDAQRVTGELLWLSQRTRIDICFSVGLMSSWVTRSPGFVVKIGLRILAYLANTKTFRLSLVPDEASALTVYTDASFAPFSERSISGIVVLMHNRCVIWKSRRQTLVSLSTAECELIAAIEGIVLGQSVEPLVEEMWATPIHKVLYVDNLAAITLAEGGGSQRTRHLRVRACYLRDQLDQRQLQVLHCPGEVQLADALTKALPNPRLVDLNRMLGLGLPGGVDPAVRAVMTTTRALHQLESSEGQSVLLVLALMMTQIVPAASQEEEENPEGLSLDLYVLGVMLACSILFVWEVGKHCIRECSCPRRSEASIAAVRSEDDDQHQRRHRRQEAIRRALEKETAERLQPESAMDLTTGVHINPPPQPPPAVQASSHVHLHLSPTSRSSYDPNPPSSPAPPHSRQLLWTSGDVPRRATSPDPPPPPPHPSVTEGTRTKRAVGSQSVVEVGVQTTGHQGLTDEQLSEIEVTTSSARTPGVLHIFPDCHVLRTVSNTHRRSFCRYCLMTLRQRGLR